jgi:hypothetical protein
MVRGASALSLSIALLVGLSSPAVAAKDDKARISELEVARNGLDIQLSFQLTDAFEEKTIDLIESGLPTGFTYDLKLERGRRWWWNKGVESATLQVSAMYNAITREYLVNYKQDGDLIDSRVVTSRKELEEAMTIFHNWPAFKLSDRPQGRLIVRLRAELGSKTILAFIPTTIHTDWTESSFRLAGEEIRPATLP